MRTIIAGSRGLTKYEYVDRAVSESGFEISQVISGHAEGIDKLGEAWARKNNKQLIVMPANWNKHGRSAGYKRNIEMAECADALIAIHDSKSKGTQHMIDIARDKGLKVYILIIEHS